MSWFVYIVECKDSTFYTGLTWNLKQRIKNHNSVKYRLSFTKSRLPVKLVYWEKHENKIEAAKREKIIKDYSRLKKKKLIDSLLRVKREGPVAQR